MKVNRNKKWVLYLSEIIKISSKKILTIWSLLGFVWGISSTLLDFSEYYLYYIIILLIPIILTIILFIKALLEIKKEIIKFNFKNGNNFFVMKNDYIKNMDIILSNSKSDDFYFAMGIDRSLDLSISTHKGILYSVLNYLKNKYQLEIEVIQNMINNAKEKQYPQKKKLNYGDILIVNIPIQDKIIHLLLVVNSEKKEEAIINNDIELVKGIDSRLIILKIFEKCQQINCENLLIGAFGTNGLQFPYSVIITEIINAYINNQISEVNGFPKNLYLSIRNEDMQRHNINHSDIVLYIHRILKFHEIR